MTEKTETEKVNMTTIAISMDTKALIDKVGGKGETYDEIVRRIFESYIDSL